MSKVGVLIPDRGDRPQLLKNCLRMIKAQTLQPDVVFLVDYPAQSKAPDLTQRIKHGFLQLKSKGCDVVAIIENDDYYSPDYLKKMVEAWQQEGQPEIFGIEETIYYHIFKKQYRLLKHSNRASLMSTLISCEASIYFPPDSEVFLDLYLWKHLKGKTITFDKPINLGLKHGRGLCGGGGHNRMTFKNEDSSYNYLASVVDRQSFVFYLGLQAGKQKAQNN